jgi:hypothetical protein
MPEFETLRYEVCVYKADLMSSGCGIVSRFANRMHEMC